jgi:hypothetical protein
MFSRRAFNKGTGVKEQVNATRQRRIVKRS